MAPLSHGDTASRNLYDERHRDPGMGSDSFRTGVPQEVFGGGFRFA